MDRVGFCLIFGTFDVDNYGDLLFPVVAGWRLSQRIIACSPTRNIPTFVRDSQEEHLSFEDLSGVYPLAILIGGGNILHFRRSGVKPYKWRWFSYAGLQLIPFLLKKRFGVPVLYNSPSIALKKDCFIWRKLFTYLFSRADYLSFRDAESVYFARQIVTKQVFCVPDTAFDVGRIWPRQDSVRPVKEDYAIVHVNKRYGGSCQQIASSLDQVQERLGLTIVFLPIGRCHGDLEYAERVASLMSGISLVVHQARVSLFAQYIANSSVYLGSSMHGFITALSYRVKAALVLNEVLPPKFVGVLSAANFSPDYFFRSWSHVPSGLGAIITVAAPQLTLIHQRLDNHWDKLSQLVERSSTNDMEPKSEIHMSNLDREVNFWRIFICFLQVFEKPCRFFTRLFGGVISK